jgi:glycosyltransferase involved in cell wall biosynthesis
MKIAVVLSALSVGARPLDFWFNNIYISTRGLTGTDLSTVRISEELVKRNHDVYLFTVHAQSFNKPEKFNGIKLFNMEDLPSIVDDSFDVVLSINDPNIFFNITSKPLRMCWEFLNDFPFAQPGFDNNIDVWLSVCQQHCDYLLSQMPADKQTIKHKWKILPLGCDPDWYEDKRVPGRIIWASSADRGLHNLLEVFPYIKKNVPEAHLRIFYHFNYDHIKNINPNDPSVHPHLGEMVNRVQYIRNAIEKLKPLGVEYVGSASQEQIRKEFSEASVLGFPTDTVAFSEGFSLTTMQSLASYTVPVITNQDCLGSVYAGSGAIIIDSPVRKNLKSYADAVIKALTDKRFADATVKKCRAFAEQYSWSKITDQFENIVKERAK